MPEFDDRDQQILNERRRNRMAHPERILVGDWVEFSDGVVRRVSYVWRESDDAEIQTAEDGSFHLCDSGDGNFSGRLFTPVPASTLTWTSTREAEFWFFHHGQQKAHNSVTVECPVNVWACSQTAPPS